MESTENKACARGNRKERVGTVVKNASQKTIVVRIVRRVPHPLYKKVVKKWKSFVAHDENNEAKAGDTVRIAETRPLSKTKHWRLVEIISKAQ